METNHKKTIFSGIQPSGVITLGNYLGALKNWVSLQDEFCCIYSVVDMHSLTVRQNPAELRKRCLDLLSIYLACGIQAEKNVLFIQSHVPQHAELSWILGCNTYMGELSRMTQFKDKSQKHEDNINAGLFTYPVLMAADILLYGTDLVPIGKDQKQHLELARDLAQRFNNLYSDTFTVPEGYFPPVGAKIMSLQEPSKKMSKSDENANAFISVLDTPELIISKIKKAVTDSDGVIEIKEGKDGICNLLSIYAAVRKITPEKAVDEFSGQGYGALKAAVGEAVVEELRPLQAEYSRIRADKAYLESVYKDGALKAQSIARKTLSKVCRKVGFVER